MRPESIVVKRSNEPLIRFWAAAAGGGFAAWPDDPEGAQRNK